MEAMKTKLEAMEAKLDLLTLESQRNERAILFVEAFSEFEGMAKKLLGKPGLVTGPDGNDDIRQTVGWTV